MSTNSKVIKSQSDIYDEFVDKDIEKLNNKTSNNNNSKNDDDNINNNSETLTMLPSIDEFFNAIKFGLNSQVTRLLEISPHFVNSVDSQGFSAIHWAAKRGDETLLNILGDRGVVVDIATTFDSRMHPIHWAASDGKIVSLRYPSIYLSIKLQSITSI
jgi:ankyrin repeat protein